MENSFYALLFRQRYIRRWGLMRNDRDESLTEHSADTAVLAHALAVIGNRYFGKNYDVNRAVTEALFHDASEVFTGDLPTPIKYYNPEMRSKYGDIENDANNALLSRLPDEMKPDYKDVLFSDESDLHKLVKAADKLSAYIKCLQELECGNNEFKKAAESTLLSINRMNLPEVEYFIKEFVPSFSKTIDEL